MISLIIMKLLPGWWQPRVSMLIMYTGQEKMLRRLENSKQLILPPSET